MRRGKPKTIPCRLCRGRVRNEFQDKWDHLIGHHPDVLAARMAAQLNLPAMAYTFGENLGKLVKKRLGL